MANEIQFGYRISATLTYIAYAPDGTARTPSVSTNLPESDIGVSGYYTQTDANVVVGDAVIVKESTNVVGYGLYENPSVADAVWDEVLTGASHNDPTSAGRRLRQINSPILLDGTSPGTNASTYINLDGDASADDGTYDPGIISVYEGEGAGQSRQIFEYDGTLKRAYINRDWKMIPDATSKYLVISNSGDTHVNEGKAQGSESPNSITLNTLASDTDDVYNEQTVFIVAGTGADQSRIVSDYDGGSHIATVEHEWDIRPDDTSIYAMLPITVHTVTEIQAGVATEAKQDIIDTNVDTLITNQLPDETLSPSGGTLTTYEKGTTNVISIKNLFDPSNNAVDSIEDIIAKSVEQ